MSLIKSFRLLLGCSLLLTMPAPLPAFTIMDRSTADTITLWGSFTELGFDILAVTQTGGVWSSSTAIGDPATSPHDPVATINSSSGIRIVAIWAGYDTVTNSASLYAATYSSGTWSSSVLLSEPSDEQVLSTYQVQLADDGTVVISYESYLFETNINVTRVIYSDTFGTFGSPVTLN